jgi:NAD(P)-dependent dehydrogenase (short-subunit alcohol dehydrogenase family)
MRSSGHSRQYRQSRGDGDPHDACDRRDAHVSRGCGAVTVEQVKRRTASRIPLQRYGAPEEVARLMLYLASDESSFCTGGVYMVDGGMSAGPS